MSVEVRQICGSVENVSLDGGCSVNEVNVLDATRTADRVLGAGTGCTAAHAAVSQGLAQPGQFSAAIKVVCDHGANVCVQNFSGSDPPDLFRTTCPPSFSASVCRWLQAEGDSVRWGRLRLSCLRRPARSWVNTNWISVPSGLDLASCIY